MTPEASFRKIAFRFNIPAELAGQVHSHAVLAARLIERLVESKAHYDALVAEIQVLRGSPAADPVFAARWSALADQLLSAREDLLALAADSRQQGTDALRKLSFSSDPATDKTLKAPRSNDALEVALTLKVVMDGLTRNCRDAAEQLQRLLIPMSKVADPAVLAFASQLEALARGLRPPGVAPGPYAPRHL